MAILPIVRLGHPALRGVARAVSPEALAGPSLQALVDDLIETMRGAHGVGLAAPQVGVSLQLFVYEVTPAPEPAPADGTAGPAAAPAAARPQVVPLRVVINPMLTPQGGEMVDDWEGCLSIPDLRGLVPRHPAVRVRGLDRQGQPLDYVAAGFEARIIQHEFDHLNGVVFLDRMRDLKGLAYREEWERFMSQGAGAPEAGGADAAVGAAEGRAAVPAGTVEP